MKTKADNVPDADLVRAARNHEREAFDTLTWRYFEVVYAIALARLKDRDRAEDLTQEVFLHAWLMLDQLQNPAIFSHWLTRMTRNLAIDWQRRGTVSSRLLPMIPIDLAPEDIPDRNAANAREASSTAEELAALQEVLDAMHPEHRELVLLHFMNGLSHLQIARQLGVNQSTVSRRLQQALAGMRGMMDTAFTEMTHSLRPRPVAQARALSIAGVLLVLPAASRSALAAAAAGTLQASSAAARTKSSSVGVLAFPHSFLSAAKSGGAIMASSKAVVSAATVAIVAGMLYWNHQSQSTPARPSVPAANLSSNDTLSMKFASPVGRRVVVRTEVKTDSQLEIPSSLKGKMPTLPNFGGTTSQDVAITTKEAQPDGSRTVEMELIASTIHSEMLDKLTPGSAAGAAHTYMADYGNKKLLVHLSPDGTISRIEGLPDKADPATASPGKASMFMPAGWDPNSVIVDRFRRLVASDSYPPAAVKAGDSWKSTDKVELASLGNISLHSLNRFVGWKLLDGHKVAEVQVDAEADGKPEITISKQTPVKMQYNKHNASGTYYYDPELSQIFQAVTSTHVEVSYEIPNTPKTPGGMTMKMVCNTSTSQKIIEDSGKLKSER